MFKGKSEQRQAGLDPDASHNRPPILLVEDNENDVRLLDLVFQKACRDIRVIRVSDGDQALRYLNGMAPYSDRVRFPFPEFLLLDLNLPGMDGFEVLARIRKRPEFEKLPIIVLTISSYSADIRRALSLGADSFITKPPNLKAFMASASQIADLWLGQVNMSRESFHHSRNATRSSHTGLS
jgi:CheY-like chemotaxis protein